VEIKTMPVRALKPDTTQSGRIITITPMMTPGGGHSEKDIPSALEIDKKRHPGIQMEYAWPYSTQTAAEFLARQIDRFI
jgi:sirohydrochlorin ferrochelatase